jgi:hypothetical protein
MRYENAISSVSMVNDCVPAGVVGAGWAWVMATAAFAVEK